MRRKTFQFDGSEGAAEMMIALLSHYSNVAFPLGGSDCAAASREALQAIIRTIQAAKMCEISRRQRPLLKSAVKWFYTQSEYAAPSDPMYDRLLSQFQR